MRKIFTGGEISGAFRVFLMGMTVCFGMLCVGNAGFAAASEEVVTLERMVVTATRGVRSTEPLNRQPAP